MTLPKGFGGGGVSGSDVDKMIGKRVENMIGLYTFGYIAAWLSTLAGTAVGYFYYPWAYAAASGHFAFIILTIIEAIGYIFCVKVGTEGSGKNYNGIVGAVIGATAVATVYISIFING